MVPMLTVPVDVPTGWLCPFCERVYSPGTGQCVICSPPPKPFAGPLPRPQAPGPHADALIVADMIARSAAKRHREENERTAAASPSSPILPLPVDEPEGGPSPEPRRHEYTFGGFPSQPSEPPRHRNCKCSPVPCQPSREGGMCGCDEPGEAAPTLILPAEMANPSYRRMLMAGHGWTEPFPGLQVRIGSYSETEQKAILEFRLTPADGQDHD